MTQNLIVKVLAAVEAQTPNQAGGVQELRIDNETIPVGSDLEEAARYCDEHKYIELWSLPDQYGGSTAWRVKRLTAKGHDKLRELRGQQPL